MDDDHLTAEEPQELDLSRKKVHRVFNNNSWTQGGRFYGAWWMECPKLLRKYIIIDGDPTVEIGCSGMHIHLLYAIEKINYAAEGEDPYVIEGFSNRGLNKYVFLIAVNAEDDEVCIRGVCKRLVDKRKLKEYVITCQDQIRDVLLAIKAGHQPI